MATATWNANKDNVSGADYGSGVDIHLPVGYMSWLPGYARAYIGFSYSWTGWTAINSATLYCRTDDGYHGSHGTDPDIYVDLITASWSEGSSASGETWHSSDDISPTCSTANRVTWDVGGGSAPAENTFYSVNITGIIQQAFANGVFYGVRLMSTDEGSSAERIGFWSTEKGSSYDAYIVVDYSTNTAPNAPTNPSPTADAIVNTLTPTFTATFSDPNAGDTQGGYQIILYEDDGTTQKWDSGTIVGSTISKVYNGPALTGNTFYKWKVRSYDAAGAWGAYTTLQRFKVNSIPNAPTLSLTQSPTTDILTLTPTFNVTHSDPDATDSQMLGYHIILETSGGTSVWDSGETTVTARTTLSLTYAGPALSWQTSYRWKARTKDSNGAWSAYSGYATFTTHTTGVPINLDPTASEVVPTDGSGNPMPTFVGSRASTSDSLTAAQIIVYQSDGVTVVWDSGSTATGVTSTGFSRSYGGTTLAYSTTYKWAARVTSSIGGTSSYSALQTFVTPAAGSISQTAPVSPVTDTTPDFTFGRSTAFNAYEIEVLRVSDSAVAWDSGTVTTTSGTSKTITYGSVGTAPVITTLAYATAYKWRVRVSADSGSTWGAGFTGYVQFTMDSAGIPTLNAPVADSWLGAPEVIDPFDNITSVTNGTSAAASQETTDKQVGRASMKVAITTLAAAGTSETYRTVTQNLSRYGAQTSMKIWVKASSLTNLSTLRLRFTFATVSDYAEFNIIPGTTNWEQKTITKGSPTATGGTVNWANVTRIGIRAVAGASSYTGNIFVDDLKIDASAPSFDGTTYNSEVISTYRIRVYSDSGGTNLIWDSGDTAGSGTTFSKLYTGTTLSKGLTYYWQARYIKSTGPTGAYSALTPFILNSDPTVPTSLDPTSGETIADSLIPVFTATFGDADKTARGDSPTAMEVEVLRNSDSTLAYYLFKDSGLVAAANTVYDGEAGVLKTTGAAAPLAYETEYKYRVRYYDAMGAIGSWSSYVVFKPSQSPTATITSPANGGTLTSPAFTTSWTHSSPGGKGQNSYQFRIVRDSDDYTVYDTGRAYSSVTSLDFPAGTLVNSTVYRVEVRTWDTDGLVTAWDSNSITTNWSAPDPVVGFAAGADDAYSAMRLRWEESTLPVGTSNGCFRKYTIYRKLPTDTTWSVLTEIVNRGTVEYLDYMTANTVTYDYKITQWKIVTGDADLESGDSDLAQEMLDADSWYVVGADRQLAHIFELPVGGSPFVEPVQQEVFEPLGTSRKVIVRGKTLGAEGSLQCRWKDEERAAAQEQIDYIKSNAGPHILKSPFGDLWLVEFSGPSKDYMGGGHMNVTLVWTEVA